MKTLLNCFLVITAMYPMKSWAAVVDDLRAAEILIWQGRAETAWQQLAPQELQRAGDPDYDYVLGLAALESGRPDLATLAFERVLARDPNFLGARLDLARAWFALNLHDLAKQELLELKSLNPPPAALASIEKYLAEIETPRTAAPTAGTAFNAWLEALLGRDSNINTSTGNASLFVPALGGSVTLGADSVSIQDDYLALSAGAGVTHRTANGWVFNASLDGTEKGTDKAAAYNSREWNLRAGMHYNTGAHTVGLSLQYGHMNLDGAPYRSTTSHGAEYRYTLTPQDQLFIFGQRSLVRYDGGTNGPNNANVDLLGTGWLRALDGEGRTLLSLSAYAGRDDEIAGRTDGDKELAGMKLGAQHRFNSQWSAQASVGIQHGVYQSINPLFLTKRRDDVHEASLGLNWQFARGWSLKPQINWLRSDSNLALYDYSRTDASVSLRHDFP
jgi:tetratricopeptide (TPR) repeat protein